MQSAHDIISLKMPVMFTYHRAALRLQKGIKEAQKNGDMIYIEIRSQRHTALPIITLNNEGGGNLSPEDRKTLSQLFFGKAFIFFSFCLN